MASFIGNAVKITVMTTAGGSTVDFEFTAFAREAEITEDIDAVETTHYGATARGYIPGLSEGTFSFTVDHDTGTLSTSPQKNLRDIHREVRGWKVEPLGTGVGKQEYTFDAFLTSAPIALSFDDVVASACELQITGSITHGTQV